MIFEIEIRGTDVFKKKSISIVSIRHDNSIGYNNKRMSWNAIFIFVNSNTCYCTSFLICLYSEGSTGRFLFHFVLSKCPSDMIRTFVTDPKGKGVSRKWGRFQLCAFFNFVKTVIFSAQIPPFCHILHTKNTVFLQNLLKYHELGGTLSYFNNQYN